MSPGEQSPMPKASISGSEVSLSSQGGAPGLAAAAFPERKRRLWTCPDLCPRERLHLGCRLHLVSTVLRDTSACDLSLTSEALPQGFPARGSPLCPPLQPSGANAPLFSSGTTFPQAAHPGCLQGQRGTARPQPGPLQGCARPRVSRAWRVHCSHVHSAPGGGGGADPVCPWSQGLPPLCEGTDGPGQVAGDQRCPKSCAGDDRRWRSADHC